MSTYGYFAGGSINTAIADHIVFATGATSANTVSNLSQARSNMAGVSDGTNYGYFAGGSTGAANASRNTTDRIEFSSGTTASNTTSNLSLERSMVVSCSDGLSYGYFAGGYTMTGGGNFTSLTDRIQFSSGSTTANTVSNLSTNTSGGAGLSDYAF